MSRAGWERQALNSIQSMLGHTDPKARLPPGRLQPTGLERRDAGARKGAVTARHPPYRRRSRRRRGKAPYRGRGLQGGQRAEDHRAVAADQQREAPAAARGTDRLADPPDHRDKRTLGKQAGRATDRLRSQERKITCVGEPGATGQRRHQAPLAQHGRCPGHPVNRAARIRRHTNQNKITRHHPNHATQPPQGAARGTRPYTDSRLRSRAHGPARRRTARPVTRDHHRKGSAPGGRTPTNRSVTASRSREAENAILVGRLCRVEPAGRAAARWPHRYRWPGGLAQLVTTMSPIQERDGRPEALGVQVTDV
jgi:hypothetical protein